MIAALEIPHRGLFVLACVALLASGCGVGDEVSAQGRADAPSAEASSSGEFDAVAVGTDSDDPDDMADWAYLSAHTPSSQAPTEWDGTINGMKTLWHPNGAKLGEGAYDNSEKTGPWVYWHDNGQKRWEGTYVRDVPRGIEAAWYDDGTQHYLGEFIDGQREGQFSYWHENGQLWWRGPFVDGKREGEFVQFERNGEFDEEASGLYRKGKRVSPLSEEARAKLLALSN